MARSASARVSAIGFSQKTLLPAAAAATTSSVWKRAGAAITTASTSGSAQTCGHVGEARRSAPSAAAPASGRRRRPGRPPATRRASARRRGRSAVGRSRSGPMPRSVRVWQRLHMDSAAWRTSAAPSSSRLERSPERSMRRARNVQEPMGTEPAHAEADPDRRRHAGRRVEVAGVDRHAGRAGRERRRPGRGSSRRPSSSATTRTAGPGCCAAAAAGCSAWCSASSTPSTPTWSTELYTAARETGYELALSAVTPRPRRARGDRRPAAGPLRGADPARPAVARREPAELAARSPVVVVARASAAPRSTSSAPPTPTGLRLAVDHLAGLGHRRIAHVDGGRAPGAADRRRGYREAMRRARPGRAGHRAPRRPDRGGRRRGGRQLLDPSRPVRATAVPAFNDRCALGVLQTAGQAGRAVPEGLSVVGYDDSPDRRPALGLAHHRPPGRRPPRRRGRVPGAGADRDRSARPVDRGGPAARGPEQHGAFAGVA